MGLKPLRTRKMSDTEAAWLAGFLDGEGCLAVYPVRDKYRAYHITVPGVHYGSLKRCRDLTDTGNVTVKHEADAVRQKQWYWRVASKRDIVDIIRQVLPYLTVKREDALVILADWRAYQEQYGAVV